MQIGLTVDEVANKKRDRDVTSYEKRKENLEDICKTYANIYDTSYEIVPIEDAKTRAIESSADYIVLSPEQKTHIRATEINLERLKSDKGRLQIIDAPLVKDYTGAKISSTNIINGQIDRHGDKTE